MKLKEYAQKSKVTGRGFSPIFHQSNQEKQGTSAEESMAEYRKNLEQETES